MSKSNQTDYPKLQTIPIFLRTQGTLGARHLALLAWYPGDSSLDSKSQSLEGTLGTVVIVVAVEAVDVQRDTGTLSETLHAVGDHLGAELAEELALQAKVDNAVGTVGEVDDGAGEGLVERSVGIAEAGKTGGSTEGLGKGVAKGNADILGGVVVINYRDKVNQSSGWWRRWYINVL